jgi:lysyl-tRNA synthetase class II
MASNGQTRQALEKCSCSIDVIASLLSHEQYIEAETVMRLRLVGGEKSAVFRDGPGMKEAVARLKRAQAEAEVRCF